MILSQQRIARFGDRAIAVFAVSAAILLFLCMTRSGRPDYVLRHVESDQPVLGILDLHLLKSYGLSETVQYARCNVHVVEVPDKANLSQQLDVPFPTFHAVNLNTENSTDQVLEGLQSPIIVQVPKPPKQGRPKIIFGVATTFQRLEASLPVFAHWANPSHARIHAILEGPASADLNSTVVRQLRHKAERLGFTLDVQFMEAGWDDRVFSLLKALFESRGDAEWVGIIDDDTMFLSISSLVSRLDTYDATRPHYVGGISEDNHQVAIFGQIAFGGAGIFLSMPLLQQLYDVYEQCHAMHQWSGDRRIAHCIYLYTDTRLTVEHGLHQVDLHGDPSGFYESGRTQPLSIHHWKSWADVDMRKLVTVSSICGDSCLLRRWRFADGWYLTNGFSIVRYSTQNLSMGDRSIEKTWDDWESANDESYIHSLAPLRPKDPEKISLRLVDAVREKERLRQIYVQKTPEGQDDRVVELVWKAWS